MAKNALPVDKKFYDNHLHGKIIKGTEILTTKLGNLRFHIYSEEGESFVHIKDSPMSSYWNDDKDKYGSYIKFVRNNVNNKETHTFYDFEELKHSFESNGYKEYNLIVTFNGDNIVRDGQHRAAILYHLFGESYEVKFININL